MFTIIILFIESLKALFNLATTKGVGDTYKKTFYVDSCRYEISVFVSTTSRYYKTGGTLIYKSFPETKRSNELWAWCDKLSMRNLKYVTKTINRLVERSNKNALQSKLG